MQGVQLSQVEKEKDLGVLLNDLFDYMYFQFPNLKIVDCHFILGEFIKTGLFNNEYKQCWPFYVSYSFILRVERAKREV